MSVLKATYNSVNTAYASMGYELNLCELRSTAWQMGFRPTMKRDQDPDSSTIGQSITLTDPVENDINIFAPMIIGTQPTSPVSQAAAYATIASGGTYCEPVAILRVEDAAGKEMKVPEAHCDPNALPENIANTITHAMKNVLTKGTATGESLDGGRPAAGKTGTTQFSSHTWFTGFTKQLSTSVWIGDSSGDVPHQNMTVAGKFHAGYLYGSHVAAPAWNNYMNEASVGMPAENFGPADPKLVGKAPKPPKPPVTQKDDTSQDSGGAAGGGETGDSESGEGEAGGGGGADEGAADRAETADNNGAGNNGGGNNGGGNGGGANNGGGSSDGNG